MLPSLPAQRSLDRDRAPQVSRTEWLYILRRAATLEATGSGAHAHAAEAEAEAALAAAEAEAAEEAKALSQVEAEALREEAEMQPGAPSPQASPPHVALQTEPGVDDSATGDGLRATSDDEDVVARSLATPPQGASAEDTSAAAPSAEPSADPPAVTPKSRAAAPAEMTVKQLRAELHSRGVAYAHCIEKGELIALLNEQPDVPGIAAEEPSAPELPGAPAAAALPVTTQAAPPVDEEREKKLDGRALEVERLSTLEIPDGVHLTLTQQPNLLSAQGRPTLLFLCEILQLPAGSTVTASSLRASYMRLALATHPDKARGIVGRLTANGVTITESDLGVAAQRVNIAHELLAAVPMPLASPMPPQDYACFAQAPQPTPKPRPEKQAQQQSWWQWWFNAQKTAAGATSSANAAQPQQPATQPTPASTKRTASSRKAPAEAGRSADVPSPKRAKTQHAHEQKVDWASYIAAHRASVVEDGFGGNNEVLAELGRRYRRFKAELKAAAARRS